MKRLILSVLAGLFTSAILASITDHILHTTGVYPPYGRAYFDTDLFLLASAYRAVYAIGAAYLTAMLAREQAWRAVWILGIIGLVLSITGAVVMWGYGPGWYPVSLAILAIPYTLIGGKLYERRRMKQLRAI